ncbi:hypothetical protein D3C81_2048460 [compost metagenome]
MVASSRLRSEIFVLDRVNRTTKASPPAITIINSSTAFIRSKPYSSNKAAVLTADNTASLSRSFCA